MITPSVPLNLMNKPAPQNLKNHQDIYRKPDTVMRVCQASLWTNSEPTEHKHNGAQQ